MIPLPATVLMSCLLGLISLAVVGLAAWFLYQAIPRRTRVVERTSHSTVHSALTLPRRTFHGLPLWAPLVLAIILLAWIFAGRYLVLMTRPSDSGTDLNLNPGTSRLITSSSGEALNVRELGNPKSPTLVFTHGWGADSREWDYARSLADRFHLVMWDLPGLGSSDPYKDDKYSLERMAVDLDSVIAATSKGPVILVGHSIGGMINLTFARVNAQDIGRRVRGMVQLNTTYTNPVRTTKNSQLAEKLQRPILEPAMQGAIALSPMVRAVGWLNYMNGLTHLHLHSGSFAGTETREQLDFTARYAYRSSPSVIARGTLAMLQWDASEVLPRLNLPVLIVSGDQDTTTVPAASVRMEDAMPKAQHRNIAMAAHLGPIEQHQQYNALIREFATSL